MAILPILKFPDPRLRTRAQPVAQVDSRITRLTRDMLETMYAARGIGLAATQVDVHYRVIVIDVSEQGDSPLVLINPQLQVSGEEVFSSEGCLSVPQLYDRVVRREKVHVEALDAHGNTLQMDADGLLAMCIQHECDHLAGKLFIDHLSELKRQRLQKKLARQKTASA